MPVTNTTDISGNPVCPDEAKTASTLGSCENQSVQGTVVGSTCDSCGDENCTTCVVTSTTTSSETVLNRDACCRTSGCVTEAPSTACSPSFQGTTRACGGHILVKQEPGDACLQHLHSDSSLFIQSDPNEGSELTNSPTVDVPGANGYQVTATGEVLTDTAGDPILSAVPEFTKLWISGVVDRGDNQLLVAKATNATTPLYLKMEGGCFSFATRDEEQLCASVLPETVSAGRLLLIDGTSSCDSQDWCVKELQFGDLAEGDCAELIVTQDADGFSQISARIPSATAGFLRSNPDAPCTYLNGDTLSTAEVTQMQGFLDQMFCETTLPQVTDAFAIERVMACGSRTVSGTPTAGLQPFTLAELFQKLEELRQTDPDLTDDPTDTAGAPLEDGQAYEAVWDATTKTFTYRLAYNEYKVAMTQIAEYTDSAEQVVTPPSVDQQVFGINLATLGHTITTETHATVLFQLDHRDHVDRSTDQSYSYVDVQNERIAWCGSRDFGQNSPTLGEDSTNGTSFVTWDVPISNGTISFTMGRFLQTSVTKRMESLVRAHLIGFKSYPL